MSKRIVLLSDGTGNSSAKVWRTNVWRTFEALDLRGNDQVAIYDDGVGTSAFKPLAVLGGAFGYGLKRNVLDLYKFACRNYSGPEDEIFAFGFSRGAFTIRIVNGLILNQGLVRSQGRSEADLDMLVRAAYRAYRAKSFHTLLRVEAPFRKLRDAFLRVRHWNGPTYSQADNWQDPVVRFLGLWDTVSAYGLPVDEMTRGVNRWLFPLALPDHRLNDKVRRVCHALALDEERTTFHPELWTEEGEKPLVPDAEGRTFVKDERISQVWFAGVHSNIGGGYPEDSLANIPFYWILKEAERCGLKVKTGPDFEPDMVKQAFVARDKDGRIYDPRSGVGGYYRYGPRRLDLLCNDSLSDRKDDTVRIARPKIHESALRRIQNGARNYGPIGIPAEYDVVSEDGEIIPPTRNPYESSGQAAVRVQHAEAVWNDVWKRRIVYFLTVGATFVLLAYPLMRARAASDELSSSLRWVSDLIRLVGTLLPGIAAPWLRGYERSPGTFVILAVIVVALTLLGSYFASKIASRMSLIWRDRPTTPPTMSFADRAIVAVRTSSAYQGGLRFIKVHLAPAIFAIIFAWLGITLVNRLLFTAQDVAGWTCGGPDKPLPMQPGDVRTIVFRNDHLCQPTGVLLEHGRTYHVVIARTGEWKDGDIDPGIDGIHLADLEHWSTRAIMVALTPLRRDWIRPWFRIIARYGRTGGEEVFFDPDLSLSNEENNRRLEARIRPTLDGELFVYVNDAVLAFPGLHDLFYRWNNKGTAEITITRTR